MVETTPEFETDSVNHHQNEEIVEVEEKVYTLEKIVCHEQ